MRASIKKERTANKALEFLKSVGVDVDEIIIAPPAEQLDRRTITREHQGEAALLFLQRPTKFEVHECPECKEKFGTNYHSVQYCSNSCRNIAFKKLTGIEVDWSAKTDTERWGAEPPLIIDPETLKHLATHLAHLQKQMGLEYPGATPLNPDPLLGH